MFERYKKPLILIAIGFLLGFLGSPVPRNSPPPIELTIFDQLYI